MNNSKFHIRSRLCLPLLMLLCWLQARSTINTEEDNPGLSYDTEGGKTMDFNKQYSRQRFRLCVSKDTDF